MSRMAHDFFAQSPLLSLPLVAMLLFGMVFVAIVVRTLRTGSEVIDRESSLPLEEESHD